MKRAVIVMLTIALAAACLAGTAVAQSPPPDVEALKQQLFGLPKKPMPAPNSDPVERNANQMRVCNQHRDGGGEFEPDFKDDCERVQAMHKSYQPAREQAKKRGDMDFVKQQ